MRPFAPGAALVHARGHRAEKPVPQLGGAQRLLHLGGIILLLPVILAALSPGLISGFDPFAEVAAPLIPPSATHPFGTDDLGRDLLSMVASGARGALLLAAIVVTLTFLIGGVVGVTAGWSGGLIDGALMRFAEFVGVLPRLLILLLVTTLTGPSLMLVAVTLGLTSWPGLARLIRAETLAQKHREHVLAARALGASDFRIMLRHLAPAAIAPALAVTGPVAASAVLTEAGLSFLGLSDPNFISWGDLIRNGQTFFHHGWWLAAFPGLLIIQTCVAFALLSEASGDRP